MWESDYKESWSLKNWCFWTVLELEKTLESPLDCKEIKSVYPKGNQSWILKDWCWSWNSNPLATWCKVLTHWIRSWYWERLKAGEEADGRGWDGWMTSPTQWTWVWGNFGSWWWTGRPGMLWSMGSQRVRHDWVTELNWLSVRNLTVSSLLSPVENEREIQKHLQDVLKFISIFFFFFSFLNIL